MKFNTAQLQERFQKYYRDYPALGLALDVSRMNFSEEWLAGMADPMAKAFRFMEQLENGAIANPDEHRMVGHYWLRNAALAPNPDLRKQIEDEISAVKEFAGRVHAGDVRGANGSFQNLLVIGIGGSALGPQFVARALGHPEMDRLKVWFFDNTDPDGMDRVLAEVGSNLGRTLCVVISKSGGTKETRNGMLEAKAVFEKAGLRFAAHAVAVTETGSQLDQLAQREGWLARFPMWDWVGGRTSELSVVGLLPAALQGIDIDNLIAGAKTCDEITRGHDINDNPSALMALVWSYIGNGRGEKRLVVLPYKDRLELFSRYLQQLVMESLGKERDLDGRVVHQGLTVFGNKGSTDQHAYVQQLRDGINDFFITFIAVLKDRRGPAVYVEPEITSGDYLTGFLHGTRQALYEQDRESITITIREVSPFAVGALIALFERAVGLYAALININAYHQPGVEAGKKAAQSIIDLQLRVLGFLKANKNCQNTVREIAIGAGAPDAIENVYHVCEHLAANSERSIRRESAKLPLDTRYTLMD